MSEQGTHPLFFHLLKTMFYFLPLVLKGFYHYWTYYFLVISSRGRNTGSLVRLLPFQFGFGQAEGLSASSLGRGCSDWGPPFDSPGDQPGMPPLCPGIPSKPKNARAMCCWTHTQKGGYFVFSTADFTCTPKQPMFSTNAFRGNQLQPFGGLDWFGFQTMNEEASCS